jgi:hypothetical protein
VSVSSARLNTALTFAEFQPVRGGLTINVALTSSTPAVGTIASPAAFSGGVTTVTRQFTAAGAGTTTVAAVAPAGFSTPAQHRTLAAQVNAASMSISQEHSVVGQNLQTNARINLVGVAPAGGLTVNITSNDPARLLLSTSPTTAGTASLTLTIPAGFSLSPLFYPQALGNAGSVTYTATAPGFGTATGTVALAPSGFVIGSPFGFGVPILTTTGAPNTPITVFSAVLDTDLNFVDDQPLRGGISASIPVSSSNPAIGTITTSPVTIAGGSSTGSTAFDPATQGSVTITAGVPAGFSTPATFRTLTANVTTPGLVIENAVIGQNLQFTGTLILGQPAPAGGQVVTLTSTDASRLVLSADPTTAGSGTLAITVPQGNNTARYFLQALGNSGTVDYTANATGFSSRTATVTLTPSGLALQGPFGIGVPFSTRVGSPPTAFTVVTAQLDPGTNAVVIQQPLRGGFSVTASLTSSNPAVGSIETPVTITSGADGAVSNFTPAAAGSTQITLQQPANFGLAIQNQTRVPVTVNP